ncbi:MAG: response regulator [Myxococcota bacterium]|jgi:PAS domain S-box-containing protein|nr:response regulator [Myxococcota bacterium]
MAKHDPLKLLIAGLDPRQNELLQSRLQAWEQGPETLFCAAAECDTILRERSFDVALCAPCLVPSLLAYARFPLVVLSNDELEFDAPIEQLADSSAALEHLPVALRNARRHWQHGYGSALSAAQWQHVFDAIETACCVSSKEDRVMAVNRAACKLAGLEADSIVGRSCDELEKTTGLVLFQARAQTAALGLCEQNGRSFHLHRYSVSFPDGSHAYVHLLDDVSEQVDAEQEQSQLQTQQQLVHRLDSIGRLAGGVAHDFNNLLSVILSYSSFAIGALRKDDPVREDIEEVRAAGERAAVLTRQLLAFARKQLLKPELLNLRDVVQGFEGMLQRTLGESIEIRSKGAPDLGLVSVDSGQLEQVILNLASNARDAMPSGGRLLIETRNVELDELYASQHVGVKPGPYVLLSFSDTGTGMDQDTMERIFEPFFTTKAKGKGTGMGLSTAYGIVKQSGGNIWVYSEVGVGSCFKVYLPRAVHAEQEQKGPQVPEPVSGQECVLLVEDMPSVRKLVSRMLRSVGYDVLLAANAQEAIELSEKHQGEIHVLLTDVVMPDLSGKELAQRLSERRSRMKVLFMSGYTEDSVLDNGLLKPGNRLISKPFSSAELTSMLRGVLDS